MSLNREKQGPMLNAISVQDEIIKDPKDGI
jgi:hypothetical protein